MKPNITCTIYRYPEKVQPTKCSKYNNKLYFKCAWGLHLPLGTCRILRLRKKKTLVPPLFPLPRSTTTVLTSYPSVQHLALFRVSQTEASTFPCSPSSLRQLWATWAPDMLSWFVTLWVMKAVTGQFWQETERRYRALAVTGEGWELNARELKNRWRYSYGNVLVYILCAD